jgi:hypothetical protein
LGSYKPKIGQDMMKLWSISAIPHFIDGCHGNSEISYNSLEFIFEYIFEYKAADPSEQFGICGKKSLGGCTVDPTGTLTIIL